jgi:hypothetical protein
VIHRFRTHPLSPRLSRLLVVLAAGAAWLATSVAPAPAATPCWKLLLNDWYDGTINNVYPLHCYRDAIKHLPTDIKVYSSAADDINRALQRAIASQKKTHHQQTTIAPIPTTTAATTTSKSHSGSHTTTTTTTKPTTTPTTTTTSTNKSPVSKAIKDITPGGADSFPLPLLILGILAIVLVLAGVGGMLWRRYQGRGGTA